MAEYLLNDQQRAVVTEAKKRYQESRDAKADFMEHALEWYKVYNMFVPKPKNPKMKRRARTAAPQAFSLVEHSTAKMKAILFPSNENNPILRALPQEYGDVDTAEVVEQKINYDLRQAKIRYKGEMWLRNFNMFGVAPVMPYYHREVKQRIIRPPIIVIDPNSGQEIKLGLDFPQVQEVTLYDAPDLRVIDIEDFFPDPVAPSFMPEDMRYCCVQYYLPYETMQTRVFAEGDDFWDLEVWGMIPADETPPTRDQDQFTSELVRYHSYPNQSLQTQAAKGVLHVMECWYPDRRIVLINRKYPLADKPNPYWKSAIPIVTPTRLPITNYPWGKGQIEPIHKTIAYMNALKNARLDTINLNVNPMWKVLSGQVKPEQLLSNPNGFIEVSDMDAIQKVDIPDYTGTVHVEEQRMIQDIEEAGNLPPVARGGEMGSGIRSQGQQLSLLETASERTQMDIDAFAETGLKPLGEWFYALNQQFLTTPQIIRVVGELGLSWVTIQPSDLQGNYDFRIEGSARSTPKVIEAEQRAQFVNLIAPILLAPTGFPDYVVELYKHVALDRGYTREARALDGVAKQLRLIRVMAGGMIQEPNGAAVQKRQGGEGKKGEGTSLQNTSTPGVGLSKALSSLG